MKLHEVVNPEKLKALRAMGQSVDSDRRRAAMDETKKRREEEKKRKQADIRLARSLGVKPGIMSHEGLMTLWEIRHQGQVGANLAADFIHSGRKKFNMRVAVQKNANRNG